MKYATALVWMLAMVSLSAVHAAAQGSKADYERAATLPDRLRGKLVNTVVRPEWLDGDRFWYRTNLGRGERRFWLVDAASATKKPLFDHEAVATSLANVTGKEISAAKLPIERLEQDQDGFLMMLAGDGRLWRLDPATSTVQERPATAQTPFHLSGKNAPHPSRAGGGETSITFINNTAENVRMFWIDPEGNRKPYNRLAPGESASQHTFARHVWVAVGPDGKDLGVFEAQSRPSIAVIEGAQAPGGATRKPPAIESEARIELEEAQLASAEGERWNGPWTQPEPPAQPPGNPDRKVVVRDSNLFLIDPATGQETALTTDGTPKDGYDGRLFVSPDAKRLVAIRTRRGADRKVHYVESSPRDQVQPRLHDYEYLKPGDEIPLSRPRMFDLENGTEVPVSDELFPTPWSIDEMRWEPDSSAFTFLYNQRGHTIMRVLSIDARTGPSLGSVRAIVNEECPTFFDYAAKTYLHRIDAAGELIWMSERDGWNHLYLVDVASGQIKNQITKGPWVVRAVDRVDDATRQAWLRVVGVRPGEDPYHVHFARVNLDGTGFTMLTEGDGSHEVVYSPSGQYLIDTYSRADLAPVSELRRADDGRLVVELERADTTPLVEAGWQAPERFVAKGRDGQTDIYGLIYRPTNFDPSRKYPVIESIYAGPHDAHVPKSFRSYSQVMELAELGFIVVQIDGMGTNWRSRAFHDVCWKNLKDGGFPDRIAWLKSAAQSNPEMDLANSGRGVGIYGGSAGGQNAMAALLWHGDFYKAAFADCGCHDNRMDKIWWNELWMSWPIGPWYEENSNAVNAKLMPDDCKLVLSVGEMDENVDPASTMQVVAALQKAGKDFDLLVFPGMGHGAAESPYGRRRRQDFFVRSLMATEPRR